MSAAYVVDADVARALASGAPLTEAEARYDLCRSGLGPMSDAAWGERWRWSAADVRTLRISDWRTRAPLPRGAR